MHLVDKVNSALRQGESETVEFKAVLPPSRSVAREIAAFANSEGGMLLLGVADTGEVVGLTVDQPVDTITHRALSLLSPKPNIEHAEVSHDGKYVYAIVIDKSEQQVLLEGEVYQRQGGATKHKNPLVNTFKTHGYARLKMFNTYLEELKKCATSAKIKVIEHYQSILKMYDDMGSLLYPQAPATATNNAEGQILSRILFASFVDNFETYLSDLLYEVYLSKPEALKANSPVTIAEVLACVDIQEFIKYCAKREINNLQKGSVKGFVEENEQIRNLKVIDKQAIKEIDTILQIRHLYAHRNGVVDEKFLRFYPGQFQLNTVYTISIEKACDIMHYLADIIDRLDKAAVVKFNLAISN